MSYDELEAMLEFTAQDQQEIDELDAQEEVSDDWGNGPLLY